MPIRMALYGVICLTALAFAAPVRAAADGPYPVWWSDKLRLESLERIGARLDLAVVRLEGLLPDKRENRAEQQRDEQTAKPV